MQSIGIRMGQTAIRAQQPRQVTQLNIQEPGQSGIRAGLSPDGATLYIYKDENNGDIYYSANKSGKWSKPKALGDAINSDNRETSVFVTPDGQKMFFSSNF